MIWVGRGFRGVLDEKMRRMWLGRENEENVAWMRKWGECGLDEKMRRMWLGLEIGVVGLPPLVRHPVYVRHTKMCLNYSFLFLRHWLVGWVVYFSFKLNSNYWHFVFKLCNNVLVLKTVLIIYFAMQILLGLSKFIAILHCKLSCQCQILKYNKILKALKVELGKVPLTERRFSKINGRVC